MACECSIRLGRCAECTEVEIYRLAKMIGEVGTPRPLRLNPDAVERFLRGMDKGKR